MKIKNTDNKVRQHFSFLKKAQETKPVPVPMPAPPGPGVSSKNCFRDVPSSLLVMSRMVVVGGGVKVNWNSWLQCLHGSWDKSQKKKQGRKGVWVYRIKQLEWLLHKNKNLIFVRTSDLTNVSCILHFLNFLTPIVFWLANKKIRLLSCIRKYFLGCNPGLSVFVQSPCRKVLSRKCAQNGYIFLDSSKLAFWYL